MEKEQKMKKRIILEIAFVLAFIVGICFASSILSALAEDNQNPSVPEPIPGLDVEKLSEQAEKSPEELADESTSYLRQEWAKIVKEKLPFLWTSHQYLLSHQTIFKIIFNREYSFTWIFFWVLVLWLYLASLFEKIFNQLGIIKQNIGIIVGFICAIILSQMNVINWIVNGMLFLVYSQEAWWMRLILWIIFIVLILVLFYFNDELSSLFKSAKKKKEEQEIKEKVEVLEAESKGREEGRKISEPIRALQKKYLPRDG